MLVVLCVWYVVLNFESVDRIPWCDHSNETSLVVFPHDTISQHFTKKNWSLLEVSGLALEIVDCSCDCCFVQSTLDVPERNIAALQEADLSKGMGLKECTHAAFSVLHALQTDLSPGTSQSLHLHFKRFFQIYKCLLHLGYLDSQALAFISRSENVYLDTKYFLQILA